MKFLYAAYGFTWMLLIAYFVYMTSGFRKVQKEFEELRRGR